MTDDTPYKIAVHLSHCDMGDYEGSCKYGDDDCPALARSKPSVDMVYVPREPTQEQLLAGNAMWHREETPLNIYRAMIAAHDSSATSDDEIEKLRDRMEDIRDERHFPAHMISVHDDMMEMLEELARMRKASR